MSGATIEERYSRAINSSHLEAKDSPGDVDRLIAAGWVRDGIAIKLYRLRAEMDLVDKHQGANDATSRLLALMQLRSLYDTRQSLSDFALWLAVRRRVPFEQPSELFPVIGRVLELWLLPLCQKCDGRGVNGGYGSPQEVCRPCRGSGRRPLHFATNEVHQQFGLLLHGEMDRKTQQIGSVMRRYLSAGQS